MKTQRRHELQTNVLADWIGHKVELVRPHLNTIGIVVAVAVLAVLAAIYFLRGRDTKISVGWEDYYFALAERDTDRLGAVAEDHPGTPAALWAKQSEADLELAKGIESLFIDRNAAKESLNRARTRYEEIEESAAGQPLLLQRARFGLAQLYEAQSNIEKAQKYYDLVAASTTDASLSKQAQQRLDVLKDPAVEKWYNWFSRQKPVPPTTPSTSGGVQLPGNLGELSDRPDITVPGTVTPPAPAGSSPAGETTAAASPPTIETPAPPTEPPPTTESSPPTTPPASPSETPPVPSPAESPQPAAEPSPPATPPVPAAETPASAAPSATESPQPAPTPEPSEAAPPPANQPSVPPSAEPKPAGG